MKKIFSTILLLTILLACSSIPKTTTYDLAIQNVSVFDSKTKKTLKNKTVLINEDVIVSIIDASKPFIASKTTEGNERLIVPGFIDTHMHLRQMLNIARSVAPEFIDDTYRKKLAEKCLPYGTTTIVDMGQPEKWMDITINWQKNPSPDYPNIFIAGAGMISKIKNRKVAQHHTVISNSSVGIEKVKQYAGLGLEHIKLYRHLNLSEMQPIVEEAKKHNITINAHVDNNRVTISEAMKFGVTNFEHFYTLTPSILDYDTHWRKMYDPFGLPKDNSIDNFSASMVFYFNYIKENPNLEEKFLNLLDKMAASNVSMSTTIQPLAAAVGMTSFFSSFNYFPIRNSADLKGYSEDQKQELKDAFKIYMNYIKIAYDKGVKLRIGTDNREVGKSMLSEMMLLVNAGFSMEDVLQIATFDGAVAMKIDDNYGSIEIGKNADLVLFDENPFKNPKNLLSTKTIIKGGKVFVPQENLVSSMFKIIEKQGLETGLDFIKNSKPNTIEAYELVEIAYHFLHSDKIKEGKTILNLVENKYPNFKNIYYKKALINLGYDYLGQGKINEALAIFKLNVEVFLNDKEVFKEKTIYAIVDQLTAAELINESIEFLELNTKVYPNSEKAFRVLGDTYLKQGEYALATKNYKESAKVNPKENLFHIAFKPEKKHVPTILPNDINKLFESRGSLEKDTAFVFVQGGPMLELEIDDYDPFIHMPNKDILRIYPLQAQILNPHLLVANPVLTKEQSEFEHQQSVEILHRTIAHLKNLGKTVFVIGHSYGGAISIAYLNAHGNEADKLIIMGNDFDEDMRSFEGVKNGKFVRWKDGTEPYLRSFYNGIPDDYPKKKDLDRELDNITMLIKTNNEKRFTRLLRDKDLSNVIVVSAKFDEANGRTSQKEFDFLKSKNVDVVETYGDHHSMFTKSFMTNLYKHLTTNALLKKSLTISLSNDIDKNGIINALKQFEKNRTSIDFHSINENEINTLGYQLIQKGKLKGAIEVFKLNVAYFPKSWNVFDSLGEAYMSYGNKKLAIKNYKESLELNPNNNYGIEALKKLKE